MDSEIFGWCPPETNTWAPQKWDQTEFLKENFWSLLPFLHPDCRLKHHGQRHGGFDAEKRVSKWFRRVHLPGWKLHRSLSSFCLAHRGRWCVTFWFCPLQKGADTNLTVLPCLPSDAPPSLLPSQAYLEIFIYCLGFFIVMVLTAAAVICRLCWAPKKSDFSSQIAVQKLAKSIPLKRQVTARVVDVGTIEIHKETGAHVGVLSLCRCQLSPPPPFSLGRVWFASLVYPARPPPSWQECPSTNFPMIQFGSCLVTGSHDGTGA